VEKPTIKSAIYEHPEFATFIASMNTHFAVWRKKNVTTLKELNAGCHPKAVISDLSEDLLTHFARKPLIDPALIESLDQLLARKRQLKQGVMEDLLTGKKRLPGFGHDRQSYRHMSSPITIKPRRIERS
jgi:hypothetical protein